MSGWTSPGLGAIDRKTCQETRGEARPRSPRFGRFETAKLQHSCGLQPAGGESVCAPLSVLQATMAAHNAEPPSGFPELRAARQPTRNLREPLFNGAFTFEQIDFELPGNNALPVALVRQHTPGRKPIVRGAMGDWDLNTPRIEGTFATVEGWRPSGGTAANRCSGFEAPPTVTRGSVPSDFQPFEYGQGVNLVVPGQGSQEVLLRSAGNSFSPTDGTSYPLVTRNNWQMACLSTLLNSRCSDDSLNRGEPCRQGSGDDH